MFLFFLVPISGKRGTRDPASNANPIQTLPSFKHSPFRRPFPTYVSLSFRVAMTQNQTQPRFVFVFIFVQLQIRSERRPLVSSIQSTSFKNCFVALSKCRTESNALYCLYTVVQEGYQQLKESRKRLQATFRFVYYLCLSTSCHADSSFKCRQLLSIHLLSLLQ